jgi:translation initiation factor IF-3
VTPLILSGGSPNYWRRRTISKDLRVNEQIRIREVRLIGENGEQLGVLPTLEALRHARERGLDLVEVAPTAVPPVCRLLDYGRFKYEQEKKDREARKNQKIVLMKEIRLRPKTDEHDIDFKSKQIERFIEEGDRVKVTLRFRGREMAHPNLGRQLLEQVADRVKNVAAVERMPLQEGNTMTMILTKAKVSAPPAAKPAPTDAPAAAPPSPDGAPAVAPATAAKPATP